MSFFAMQSPHAARRAFLGKSGLLLSGTAVALLAGREALARVLYLLALELAAAPVGELLGYAAAVAPVSSPALFGAGDSAATKEGVTMICNPR